MEQSAKSGYPHAIRDPHVPFRRQAIRREGFPDYQVWPAGENGDYRVVESIADARDIMMRELKWYHDEVVVYRVSGQSSSSWLQRLDVSHDQS